MKRLLFMVAVLGWVPTLALVWGGWWPSEPLFAQRHAPVKVTRLYTGSDGKTHVEEYEIPVHRMMLQLSVVQQQCHRVSHIA